MLSNHCPLLLLLHENKRSDTKKLFRFETMWMSHPDLINIVFETWGVNTNLLDTIPSFTDKVKEWNKTNFGNIFYKKNKLLRHLDGIQKIPNLATNYFLQNLEVTLI